MTRSSQSVGLKLVRFSVIGLVGFTCLLSFADGPHRNAKASAGTASGIATSSTKRESGDADDASASANACPAAGSEMTQVAQTDTPQATPTPAEAETQPSPAAQPSPTAETPSGSQALPSPTRLPESKAAQNTCTAKNPNVAPRIEAAGTGCDPVEAQANALKSAKHACSGEHDPKCEGGCTDADGPHSCRVGATMSWKTKSELRKVHVERCPDKRGYEVVLTGDMGCRCFCP